MNYLSVIRARRPLVECITNAVTVNDVANTILSVGGSPVMGVEESELEELIGAASSVVLNIGTATSRDVGVFHHALELGNRLGKPVVLDPVGAGATRFRTEFVQELVRRHHVDVIRGNASEIGAIAGCSGRTTGVDANASDVITEERIGYFSQLAEAVARDFSAIVSMSGAIDVISDGIATWFCRNGVPRMSQVTGTGCSLTGLTAAFVGAHDHWLEAAAYATAAMGCAGELADVHSGLGAFHVALLDALSTMTDETLNRMARLSRQ